MRAILILVATLSFFGCERPFFDLREPIYLVAEESFWSGCEKDERGYMACQAERMDIVFRGVKMWFRNFDEATRPIALIIYPEENAPEDAVNEAIHLRISGDSDCDDDWVACYEWGPFKSPTITFRDPKYEDVPKVAHEFGHAIWLDGHVTGRLSNMDKYALFYVVPLDVTEMCAANGTCPAHDEVWCEGSFYDQWRCPSSSPEEGVAMLLAKSGP